jgi:hypothetical protein
MFLIAGDSWLYFMFGNQYLDPLSVPGVSIQIASQSMDKPSIDSLQIKKDIIFGFIGDTPVEEEMPEALWGGVW